MKIYTEFPKDLPPTALTIGTFDGVHLGHQALLNRMKELNSHRTVLTFSNHPATFLTGTSPYILTPLPLKLSLLEALQVDAVVIVAFDERLQNLSFEMVLEKFPLTHLVQGEADAFGRGRQGTPEAVKTFAKAWGFSAEYLPKICDGGSPVSSSRIRALIQSGAFVEAERLLTRPHTLLFPQLKSAPPVLPPDGTYSVLQGERKAKLTLEKGRFVSLTPSFREPFLVTFAPWNDL